VTALPQTTSTLGFELGPDAGQTDTAVLLLHGFTGSPWEVRPLGEALAARGWHVLAPRLPGHGESPEAMLFTTWHEWLAGAEAALQSLHGRFPRVVVAGLSMGGLLSLILSAWHASEVQGLVLMAPVMAVAQREGRLLRHLRFLPLKGLKSFWVNKHSTDLADDDARAAAPLLPRYPVARLFDLFTLQDLALDLLPQVTMPTLIFKAAHDHVVAPESIDELHDKLPHSRLVTLQRGNHIIPRDLDRARVVTEIADFIEHLP
jgi:carboxylesterase